MKAIMKKDLDERLSLLVERTGSYRLKREVNANPRSFSELTSALREIASPYFTAEEKAMLKEVHDDFTKLDPELRERAETSKEAIELMVMCREVRDAESATTDQK